MLCALPCSEPRSSHESEVIGWKSPKIGHAAANDGSVGRLTASSNADGQRSVDRGKGKKKKKSKKSVTRTPPSSVSGERRKTVLVEPPATRGWKRTASGDANATADTGGHRVGYGRKGSTPRETKPPSRTGAVTREAASAAAKSASTGLDPARLEYPAMIPFLRSEGWKCADGKGFHTWFFVVPAKETHDGKKRVDYLVSEEEVVRYVLRNKGAELRVRRKVPHVCEVTLRAKTGTTLVAIAVSVAGGHEESVVRMEEQLGLATARPGGTRLLSLGPSLAPLLPKSFAPVSDPSNDNEWHGVHADSRHDSRKKVTAGSRTKTGFCSSDATNAALSATFGFNNTGRAASLRDFSRGVGHQLAQAGGHLGTGSRAGTFGTGSRPGTFAGGAQRQKGWQADRGRPQVTVEKALSWLEIWPKLRREGWHWDYGEQADPSCVYLKPGVSKDDATLGVDMFDSKHAVIAHVLKHATSSPTPHTAEHTVVGDSDGDENIDVVDGELSSNAWLAAAATGKGEGNSAKPGAGRAVRVPEKKRGVAVFDRHYQGDLPFPAVKRGRVEPSRGVEGGKAAAGSGDEIEVAASLVMEMLRGEMEESVSSRSVESATQQLDAEGGSRGDKLTAHCCEQLLALSESGSGTAVGGSDVASASNHCEGGDVVTGKGSVDRFAENGGTGSSDSANVDVVENDAVPLNHLLPISRGSSGSANADDDLGATLSSSPPREGPLTGVGVILAGLGQQSRQQMEAKIRNLGAEVVDILGKSDGWRSWLLRESTRAVVNSGATAGPSSARHDCGSGDCNGDPCATANSDASTPESTSRTQPQMRIIAVAAPGSDRTPEFHFAVAAGMPIVHPSYVEACSGMEIEVETGRYLLPLGRSGLGNRPLIMPFRSSRGRPFQDQLVILCVDNPTVDQAALENWLFILKVGGATVRVLDVGGEGGCAGGNADGVEHSRCTHDAALQLLQEGRVYCVIGSESTAVRYSAARSEIQKAAVEAGTLTGSLEWALQCMAHGRLLLPSAATCPWFPLNASGVSVVDGHVQGSGVNAVIRVTDEPVCLFYVHCYGGRRYVAGDYVIIETDGNASDITYGTGAETSARTTGVVKAIDATEIGLSAVARVISFRREGKKKVKVEVAMLGQGEGPMLHQVEDSNASNAAGAREQEVGEDRLGARVLVLTKREMEATQLHALNDGAIYCLKD
ncbi:unnamed protein product [Ectocarpus sp. CCAP 1310/34]|nr:unnamed protein product [Ectocarpus sp. CCAP 1310/34]